jgi:hypothetical protein
MAKNTFQDVVPGKRSIRDVPLPSRRIKDISQDMPQTETFSRPEPKITTRDIKVKSASQMPPSPPASRPSYNFDYDDHDETTGRKRWGLWSLVLVFVLAIAFGISSLFASAQVTVTPKNQTAPIDMTLGASLNQPATQFGYQIVSVSASAQQEVAAGTAQNVTTKASGTIMIYNTGSAPQTLVATTRFSTTAGLIYRIASPVTIPASQIVSGKAVPGSVSATVTADQPGGTYNIPLSDFTVPGFKGTAKYTQIYARSETVMSGGGTGQEKTVDAATEQNATNALQNSLKTTLQTQLVSQIPANFILYPSSIAYAYGDIAQASDTTAGKTMLTLSGTASAVIFDTALLSQTILTNLASSTTLTTQGSAAVTNLSSLTFVLDQPTVLTKDYTGTISFELSGDAKVVWLFDASALKSDLIGLKKANLLPLLQAKYPTIDSASAKIFPIWNGSFPSNPDKITITQTQ